MQKEKKPLIKGIYGINDKFKTYKVNEVPRGIFKAVIVPRPIGWISSVDADGNHNIAPFSYFNAVCDNPPTVMVSMTDQHKEGGPKDTLKNIEETGHFVVNIVTRELFEQMNLSSADLIRKEDEFEFAKIKWLDSDFGPARRVKDSPIHLECKYVKSVELPKGNQEVVNRMVIGTVIATHVKETILTEEEKIDYNKAQFIARLGYNDYMLLDQENIFKGIRPKT
jgi:flavin reductase (DIM6/NTAB) family NADH-FMN oxidoreductase RutF